MKYSTILTTVLLAVSGANGSPLGSSDETGTLAKRGSETVYLANCEYLDSVGNHRTWSEIQVSVNLMST